MVEKNKNQISDRNTIFRLLTWSAVISLGLYFYFLGNIIHNVVERQHIERTILSIQGDIEKLETTYSDLKSRVTVGLAESKGFSAISATTYISRNPLGKGLSLNNEI